METRAAAAADEDGASATPVHTVRRQRDPTTHAPVRTWDECIARFDSLLGSSLPANPNTKSQKNKFVASDFNLAMTTSLETYGLKKDSETVDGGAKAAYNVVLASEAQFAHTKFFIKRSRTAFSDEHMPKIYVTCHDRMHQAARKKSKWLEVGVTMLGDDPAYLQDCSDGSSDSDDDYRQRAPAPSASRRTPAAPTQLTLVPKVPDIRATAESTVAQLIVREFEQYVEGDDSKYYSPYGLYTKAARTAEPSWKAGADNNNSGTFGERCKMYYFVKEMHKDEDPGDIRTGGAEMRNSAMRATQAERSALTAQEKPGFWWAKAHALYEARLDA